MSMIQSAAWMTSRLCSMTSSEWPATRSLRNARSSLATSSKCRPVVGSSNRNSLPRCVVLESTEPPEAQGNFRRIGKEGACLGDGEVQHLGDVQAPPVGALATDVAHLVAVAAA